MSFDCDDHEFSCHINDEASICTAELLAIEAAIEYIWDTSDEEFMIITDSLSSLQALKSQKLNNPNRSLMTLPGWGRKVLLLAIIPVPLSLNSSNKELNAKYFLLMCAYFAQLRRKCLTVRRVLQHIGRNSPLNK